MKTYNAQSSVSNLQAFHDFVWPFGWWRPVSATLSVLWLREHSLMVFHQSPSPSPGGDEKVILIFQRSPVSYSTSLHRGYSLHLPCHVLEWHAAWLEALTSRSRSELSTGVRGRAESLQAGGRSCLAPLFSLSAPESGRFQKPCRFGARRHWPKVLGVENLDHKGLPRWHSWWRTCLPLQERLEIGFHPGVGNIPWRRKWQPTPGFLPGESHGQRRLVGYSPWGCKDLDLTEAT